MAENKESSNKPIANGQIKEVKNTHIGMLNESIRDAKDHVIRDVLKPMIRNYIGQIISESVNKAVEIIFGTKGGSYRDDYRDRRDEIVPYSSYYKYGDNYDRRDDNARYIPRYAYWDVEFDSKIKADSVLKDLRFVVQDEGAVDLATFYELSGNKGMIGPEDFVWGWDDLRGVEIFQNRHGYWQYANLRRVKPIPKRRR